MRRLGDHPWLNAAIAVWSLWTVQDAGRLIAQQPPPADPASSEDTETLLRGPLHEAFAGPIEENPRPGLVVPKQPPDAIEEIPPEAQPAEENAIWIPGYWAWDEERDDFIYVSGVWRVPPDGRRWVPGYWTEAAGGWQWISGFWAAADAGEVRYLPTPPATLESGPTSPQPAADYSWVSGCWFYRDDRFVWRPGYWNAYYDGWVWTPSHYVWTPHGAVFVPGYWDYPFPRRGVVFAPVWFPRPIYVRHGYCYSPRTVVDPARVLVHLFVYPRRCHYYWGDYYGFRPHGGHAFHAWCNYHGRHGYDPLFAYYTVNYHRHNIDYAQRLRGWHDYFQRHEEYRPPRTLHGQTELAARIAHRGPELKYALLGNSVSQALERTDAGVRLERIPESHRQAWKGLSDQMRDLTRHRVQLETGHGPKPSDAGPSKPEAGAKPGLHRPDDRLKLPDLPEIARIKPPMGVPRRSEDQSRRDSLREPGGERGNSWRDLVEPRRGPDAGPLRQPETRPPEARTPRFEIPKPSRGPDAAPLRQPEIRPPEASTPRFEIPKPSRGPDAAPLRQPETRPPEARTPRFEIPKPSRGPDAAPLRQPEIRPPEARTPRFEIPKASRGPDAAPFRLPEAGRPSVRAAPELPPRVALPNSDSARVAEPRGHSPRSEAWRVPPTIERTVPRIEIPRNSGQRGFEPSRSTPSFRTERADRGAARPEFSRPPSGRPSSGPPPGDRGRPQDSGGNGPRGGRGRP